MSEVHFVAVGPERADTRIEPPVECRASIDRRGPPQESFAHSGSQETVHRRTRGHLTQLQIGKIPWAVTRNRNTTELH